MSHKTTSNLLKTLKDVNSREKLSGYIKRLDKQGADMDFKDYYKSLPEVKALKSARIIESSGINRTYYYQLMDGTRSPGRDKILLLCLAARLPLNKVQRALEISGQAILYARNKRDSAIIFAVNKKLTVPEVNELLFQLEEPLLK